MSGHIKATPAGRPLPGLLSYYVCNVGCLGFCVKNINVIVPFIPPPMIQ